MRRGLLVCVFASALAVASAQAATNPPPRANLQGFVCQRASSQLDRAIEVWGVMRPVTGTQTMQMKFVLLRRSASGDSFSPVRGGGVGHWRQAKPGTELYRVQRLVANLPAPAVYRFAVTFRWTGADGSVLSRTTLLSARCYQPQ
jgi:hypothetical protein